MKPIITVENLSKHYQIGARQDAPAIAARTLASTLRAPFKRLSRMGRATTETMWALKDINFEVKPGEIVGIIGRNGAGKSTLLKILSRITEPTTGRIKLYGRVGSLLEVGTGFHPELTGRENIYLNGTILGMRHQEIVGKFDEIVAFAEIEKFLDTPVKRYSSGMYVRLAFAVAAHLQPEILIVDEVLAVGDATFQKKCLGKMGDIAKHGRTILFVSHNIGAVLHLCSRAILLKQGECLLDGDPSMAAASYQNEDNCAINAAAFDIEPHKDVQIMSVSVTSPQGEVISTCPHTQTFCVQVDYRVSRWKIGSFVCVDVLNERELLLLWSSDVGSVEEMIEERSPGLYRSRIMIPGEILAPGRYYFSVSIYAPGQTSSYDTRQKIISVEVTDAGSLLSSFGIKPPAATMIPLAWQTVRVDYEALPRKRFR